MRARHVATLAKNIMWICGCAARMRNLDVDLFIRFPLNHMRSTPSPDARVANYSKIVQLECGIWLRRRKVLGDRWTTDTKQIAHIHPVTHYYLFMARSCQPFAFNTIDTHFAFYMNWHIRWVTGTCEPRITSHYLGKHVWCELIQPAAEWRIRLIVSFDKFFDSHVVDKTA